MGGRQSRSTKFDILGWSLITIGVIIFIIVLSFIIYFGRTGDIVISEKFCPIDLCATSIITGQKRCPDPGKQVEQNPALEYCTSRSFCQDSRFPCAVLQNGSTDCSGECGVGNPECDCVDIARCPPFIASYFIRNRDTLGGVTSINQASSYADEFETGETVFTSGGAISLGTFLAPKGTCSIDATELSLLQNFDSFPDICQNGVLAILKDAPPTTYVCIYTNANCDQTALDFTHVTENGIVTCEPE